MVITTKTIAMNILTLTCMSLINNIMECQLQLRITETIRHYIIISWIKTIMRVITVINEIIRWIRINSSIIVIITVVIGKERRILFIVTNDSSRINLRSWNLDFYMNNQRGNNYHNFTKHRIQLCSTKNYNFHMLDKQRWSWMNW